MIKHFTQKVTITADEISMGFSEDRKKLCIALGCEIDGSREYIGGEMDINTSREFLKTLQSMTNN